MTTRRRRRRWRLAAERTWRTGPGWAQALAVYAVARLVTVVVLTRVAQAQPANPWTGADPGYLEFASIWDGEWYRRIAQDGYPEPLPRDEAGRPTQSEWAFYPAYPLLVRGVMTVLGTPWTATAPLVSLLLGAAAVVVVYRLFALVAAPSTALAGVALVSVFPSAPVLQLAYTESLALLALAASLYLLETRRYLAAMPAVLLLGFTRAVAMPFAVVVAVHLVQRWRRRGHDPFPARERAAVLALGGVVGAAGVAWPLVVAAVTGDLTAYPQVQAAWRGGGTEWVTGWWATAQRLLGDWLGPVTLVALLGLAVRGLAGAWGRPLPAELRAWCLAYIGYLVVVVEPFTSVFRFLLLLFPLALPVARGITSRAHLLTWVLALLSLQVAWVVQLWRFSPPRDYPP